MFICNVIDQYGDSFSIYKLISMVPWLQHQHPYNIIMTSRDPALTGRIRIQGQGIASSISGQQCYEFGVNETWQSGLVWSRLWSKSASQVKTSDTLVVIQTKPTIARHSEFWFSLYWTSRLGCLWTLISQFFPTLSGRDCGICLRTSVRYFPIIFQYQQLGTISGQSPALILDHYRWLCIGGRGQTFKRWIREIPNAGISVPRHEPESFCWIIWLHWIMLIILKKLLMCWS